MIMVGIYGLMRSENLTLSRAFRASRIVTRSNVHIAPTHTTISFTGVKGSPLAKHKVLLPHLGRKWHCPSTAVQRHLRRSQGIFLFEHSGQPVRYTAFLQDLNSLFLACNLDPSHIGTHSLRRTGVQLFSLIPDSTDTDTQSAMRLKGPQVLKTYTKPNDLHMCQIKRQMFN
jgi:hypothetical protein